MYIWYGSVIYLDETPRSLPGHVVIIFKRVSRPYVVHFSGWNPIMRASSNKLNQISTLRRTSTVSLETAMDQSEIIRTCLDRQ